jgi:hypothetical protein
LSELGARALKNDPLAFVTRLPDFASDKGRIFLYFSAQKDDGTRRDCRYLTTTSIAYDAAFENMASLSPVEKYKSKADGRHGGMLDLPLNSAKAFTRWFNSRSWAGAHPWEIVYGNPHGVMLSPCHDEKTSTWSFDFSVHTESLYAIAVKMATALARHTRPFEFCNSAKVVAVLRGDDMVEVGTDRETLEFEDLKGIRPDSIQHIQWDPIPKISPISEDQLQRLSGLIAISRKPGREIAGSVEAIFRMRKSWRQ